MRKILTAAILALTGLAGAVGAEAHDGPTRGPEPSRVHEYRSHRHREEHGRVPAPRFERVYVGRDACGRPVYRLVRLPQPRRFCD